MARIPLGNFGQGAGTAPLQRTRIENPVGAVADATLGLAQTVGNIAQQRIEKIRQDNDDLARAKASNALLDHEIAIKDKAKAIEDRIAVGDLDYRDADKTFEEEVGQIDPPKLEGMNPALAETMQGGIKRINFNGRTQIDQAVETAKRADFKGQVEAAVDKLSKLAGLPGADIAKINTQIAALAPMATRAALDPKIIQDAQDRNWTTQVQQRVIGAQGSMEKLLQVQHDLTDDKGFYADKLDPEKRTMAWRSVQADIAQLENKQRIATDRREALAEKETNWFRDQIVVGQKITPERWQEAAAAVKGTTQETEFQQIAGQADEILKVRTMPFAEQKAYIQQLRTHAATTASDNPKRDQTRLDTLQRVLDEGQKLATESPLLFLQNQTGTVEPPIDLQSALSGDSSAISQQLQLRYATLTAARKQYGAAVSMNPWLPQEAEAMKSFMATANDKAKLNLLGLLKGSAPDAKSYAGALAPLASDQRVTMLAGMAQFRKLRSAQGIDVAPTMLSGERIWADKSVPMPAEEKLRAAFEKRIGDALPDGSRQRADAYLVFKSLYAGMAGPQHVRHEGTQPEPNDRLADSALNVATGGVVDYNGHKVIRPYGMSEDDFNARLESELGRISTAIGFSVGQLDDMPLISAPGQEGNYFLLNGGSAQLDPKTGRPVVVKIR